MSQSGRNVDVEKARDELFSHIHRCGVLKALPEHQIEWMEDKVGRYPFETYGLLLADASTSLGEDYRKVGKYDEARALKFRQAPADLV